MSIIINFFKNLLTPPNFPDDEKTRVAHTLHSLLIALSIMLLLAIPTAVMVTDNKLAAVAIFIFGLLVNFVTLQMVQHGRVRAAIIGYLLYSWFNSAAFMLLADGAMSAASGLFMPIIALSVLFLGFRASLITAVISLIYLLGLILATELGLSLPHLFVLNEFTSWIVFLFSSILVLIPLTLMHKSLRQALNVANEQLSQRKNMEKALRDSEERFRIISSVTSDYTFSSRLDAQGKFEHILLTGAFEAISGYTADEFIKNGGWRSTLHPDDYEADERAMNELRQNKTAMSEVRIIRKNGDVRWVHVYAHPVWDTVLNRLVGINGGVQDITERKLAAEALQESELRYRTLVEAFPDLILVTNYSGKVLFANPEFEKQTGMTLEEVNRLGGGNMLIHPDDKEFVENEFRKLIHSDKQSSEPIENRIIIGNKIAWYRGVVCKMQYEGSPAFMVISRNITERKEAEEAVFKLNAELENKANQFSTLNEIARDISLLTDLGSTLEAVLTKLKAVLPLDAFFVALYDPEMNSLSYPIMYDAGQFYEQEPSILSQSGWVAQVLRTGQPRLINRDPNEIEPSPKAPTAVGDVNRISASILIVPLPIGDKNIGILSIQSYTPNSYTAKHIGILVGAGRQIAIAVENARLYDTLQAELSERKRLEGELQEYTNKLELLVEERTHALRRAKEQVELILNNTSDALLFADSNGDIVVTNPAFREGFGDEGMTAIEHIFAFLPDEEEVAAVSKALLDVIEYGKGQRVTVQIHSKNSETTKDLDIALIPVHSSEQETLTGILLSGRDITQQKAVERFKARFVADALHDLATPISGISTRTYLLERSPERLTEHVEALQNQVQHLRNLLEDLRTLSKLDRAEIDLYLQKSNINDLVKRVFDTYEPVAMDKQQTLILKLEESLPDLSLDQRQIERVLVNLVSNAVNYTAPYKQIVIETLQNEDSVIINVIDHGMGIGDKDLPQVFERFFRTDEARINQQSGTGLGLAITKEIIELHGGTVSAKSKLGVGSTFTVCLPI